MSPHAIYLHLRTIARNHAPMPTFDTLAKRLQHVLKLRNTNASALSEKAGLSRGAIRHMIARDAKSGDASARIDTLRAIAKAADVRPEWLIGGEGEHEIQAVEAPQAAEPVASTEEERVSMIEAALVLFADRWHPETILAARSMRMYRGSNLTREKLIRMLDLLDKGVRESEAAADPTPSSDRKK